MGHTQKRRTGSSTVSDDFVVRPKMRRRKKAHDGQDWDQSDVIEELEAARRKNRKFCKTCRKFKPWKSLDSSWEWAGKHDLQLVWYCRDCGSALQVNDYKVKRKKRKKGKKKKS